MKIRLTESDLRKNIKNILVEFFLAGKKNKSFLQTMMGSRLGGEYSDVGDDEGGLDGYGDYDYDYDYDDDDGDDGGDE